MEIQQENEEEKNILDEESFSLMKLQSKLHENFNDIHDEASDLNRTEIIYLKQDSVLILRERLMKRVSERRQRILQTRDNINIEKVRIKCMENKNKKDNSMKS